MGSFVIFYLYRVLEAFQLESMKIPHKFFQVFVSWLVLSCKRPVCTRGLKLLVSGGTYFNGPTARKEDVSFLTKKVDTNLRKCDIDSQLSKARNRHFP